MVGVNIVKRNRIRMWLCHLENYFILRILLRIHLGSLDCYICVTLHEVGTTRRTHTVLAACRVKTAGTQRTISRLIHTASLSLICLLFVLYFTLYLLHRVTPPSKPNKAVTSFSTVKLARYDGQMPSIQIMPSIGLEATFDQDEREKIRHISGLT